MRMALRVAMPIFTPVSSWLVGGEGVGAGEVVESVRVGDERGPVGGGVLKGTISVAEGWSVSIIEFAAAREADCARLAEGAGEPDKIAVSSRFAASPMGAAAHPYAC